MAELVGVVVMLVHATFSLAGVSEGAEDDLRRHVGCEDEYEQCNHGAPKRFVKLSEEQEQDDDQDYKPDTTTTVIPKARASIIAAAQTKEEDNNENDEQHLSSPLVSAGTSGALMAPV